MATKGAAVVTKSAAVKAKKASPTKKTTKAPTTHPKYLQMIEEAIMSLKERSGSSQYAIAKFIEEHHKSLPTNFKKQLLLQLKKFVGSNKLTKVKNSYKITAKPPSKKTTTPKKVVAKKAKSVKSPIKPKPKSKVKMAAAAKRIAAVKKAKTPVKKAKK
ncbi:chromatin/chromatin-binding, or -regulatory protein [Lithospermum erythrorhizon]|uniref:Chromatin/chromatin-binding, or -regulatory protein n=1 Tax=Lithospermum erythrorhizon TaxID=34254 RepID=A0AAV3NV29_LITER